MNRILTHGEKRLSVTAPPLPHTSCKNTFGRHFLEQYTLVLLSTLTLHLYFQMHQVFAYKPMCIYGGEYSINIVDAIVAGIFAILSFMSCWQFDVFFYYFFHVMLAILCCLLLFCHGSKGRLEDICKAPQVLQRERSRRFLWLVARKYRIHDNG